MTLSASLSEITQALVDKLVADATALGLKAVFYGDQVKLPTTPIACVEPGNKDVIAINPFRKTEVEITAYIIVYESAVESPETNRKNADILAEAIETLVNADSKLKRIDGSDRVISCYIKQVVSDYAKKGNSIVRASRLTFSARTQDQLPQT